MERASVQRAVGRIGARPEAGPISAGEGPEAPVTLVRRFSRTERAIHWIHAGAFLVLLGSGAILYLPSLSQAVGRRPLVVDVHVYTALAWALALVLVVLVGDRRGLRRTVRELELFDDDDRAWLRLCRRPQGRFNAGQKLNAALTAAFAILLAVSGLMLWLGERFASFRTEGAILVHDWVTYVSLVLLAGHLYLAVLHPATRHALRGVTRGTVDEEWARRHHSKWVDDAERG
jgi:formate dehydrogenase subunit gamma